MTANIQSCCNRVCSKIYESFKILGICSSKLQKRIRITVNCIESQTFSTGLLRSQGCKFANCHLQSQFLEVHRKEILLVSVVPENDIPKSIW